MTENMFPLLRDAMISNEYQYYDEHSKQIFLLNTLIIVYFNSDQLWLSTYNDNDKYFYCRPLLIENNRIILKDISHYSLKIKYLGEYYTTSYYTQPGYAFYKINIDDFTNEKIPFSIVEDWLEAKGKEKIVVRKIVQTVEQFTKNLTLIYPLDGSEIVDEQYVDLYNKIVFGTGGSSSWSSYSSYSLYPELKLTMKNCKLYYIITRIYGDCSNYGDDKFDITIENGKFIIKEGTIEFLKTSLDRYISNIGYRCNVLKYRPVRGFYLEDLINKWIIEGVPMIDIQSRFSVYDGEIYLSEMKKGDVELNFVGLSKGYLNIIDNNSGESWTFTDDPNYASVKIEGSIYLKRASDFYKPDKKNNNNCLYMTHDLRTKGTNLLQPFIQELTSC